LPYLALGIALVFYKLSQIERGKVFILIFILIYIIFNFLSLKTARSSYSYKDKVKALKEISQFIKENPYSLEVLGECARFGGYRYLAEYILGKPPVYSYMDSYFQWLYKHDQTTDKPRFTVLFDLIDYRESEAVRSKWEADKFNFLTTGKIVKEGEVGTLRYFILQSEN
jgi:hypothetical protein